MDINDFLLKNNLHFRDIQFVGSGWDSLVYSVDNDLILKISQEQENRPSLVKEGKIIQYLFEKTSIPVPKIFELQKDGKYLIMSKSQGVNISENNFRILLPDLYEMIGTLSELNPLTLEPFEISIGKTLEERFENLKDGMKICSQYLDNDLSIFVNKYIDLLRNSKFETQNNQFCHNDISLSHVFVLDNKISSVIDWADAEFSDPAYEFGRLMRETYQTSYIKSFLREKGAKEEFIMKAEIYAVLSCVEDIIDGINAQKLDYAKHYVKRLHKLEKSVREESEI